jgi:radical SAM protein with 4Fe4S-binding SPASM domain
MVDMDQTNKAEFGFQWHITDRCNLRCTHCYQEDYSGAKELGLDSLKRIADKIITTLSKWNKRGDIAITGGEPLLKKEMFPLIHYLESADEISSVDILSNGTLINAKILAQIQHLTKLRCVQVSLEGASPESNDAIRGEGTFQKVMRAIRLLRSGGVSVNIMFTLQRRNVEDVPSLIDLAIAEGISSLTIERFVPTGSGAKIREELLPPEEIKRVFDYISERAEQEIARGGLTSISRSRPLWVMCNRNTGSLGADTSQGDTAGGICSIGLDGLCILPDATVLPCRRLPIPIGNLKNDSLLKIWHTSDLLWKIADKRNLKGKCNSCEFSTQCSGCRAMAYACTGDYLAEDPQCWKQETTRRGRQYDGESQELEKTKIS